MKTIDLSLWVASFVRSLKGTSSYAHQYDNVLTLFALLAHADERLLIEGCPTSWAPLLIYLGHDVPAPVIALDTDGPAEHLCAFFRASHDARHAVEVCSTLRPELTHALYLVDTAWPCPLRVRSAQTAFPVTCNGSFFRDEVQAFLRELERYTLPSQTRRLVIVPCAADKPYPAPLHQAVLDLIGDDHGQTQVVIATGVLGCIPQGLWGLCPAYDSGLPNFDRCADVMGRFLRRHAGQIDEVIVYSDFYAPSCARALEHPDLEDVERVFLFGDHPRDHYDNLMLPMHLNRLQQALLRRIS